MSTEANADQKEFWNSEGGKQWVKNQETMDRTLAPFTELVLEALDLKAHEKLVDVGCGCGGTSLHIAERLSDGSVVGVDISEPMVSHAKSRKENDGIGNVEFHVADASSHDFSNHEADALFSRFGVMFFDNPVGAFSNLRTALKPGGRMAFACWQPVFVNEWMTVPMGAALPLLPPLPQQEPRAPGPFAFSEPDYVTEILEKSGFADVKVEGKTTAMVFESEDERSMAREFAEMGPVGRMITSLEPAKQEEVFEAMTAAIKPHFNDGRLSLNGAIHLVTARNG